jgi:hypothetical protein
MATICTFAAGIAAEFRPGGWHVVDKNNVLLARGQLPVHVICSLTTIHCSTLAFSLIAFSLKHYGNALCYQPSARRLW